MSSNRQRIIFVIGLILLFSTPAIAGGKKINVGLWGKFNAVNMGNVNNELKAYGDLLKSEMESIALPALETSGYSGSVNLTTYEIKSAFVIGIEATYNVFTNLEAGIKIGNLSLIGGECVSSLTATNGMIFLSYNQEITTECSLIPILAGGKYSYPIGEKISLVGEMFAGLGFADSTVKISGTTNIPGISVLTAKVPAKNSAFNFDGNIGINYQAFPETTIGFTVGYLYARIPELIATTSADIDGDGMNDVEKDDIVRSTIDNSILFMDFSGLSASLEMILSF